MHFNNIDLSGYFKINEIKGRGLMSNDLVMDDNATGRGQRFRKRNRPVRTLEVAVTIIVERGANLRARIDDLNGILGSVNEPVKITFEDEPGIAYYGIPEESDEDEDFSYFHKGTIKFVCPNPDKFGKDIDLNVSTTNTSFAITGKAPAPWTSKTTFTAAASKYTLEAGVGQVVLNYDFVEGDVLEIEYIERDVFLNGKDLAVAIDLTTEWFELKPGNMTMKTSAATTVSYTQRFY